MKFRKTIGDSWKILQGFTMQHKEDQSGCSILTFTKQVEDVILGVQVKALDDGSTSISPEYVFDLIEDYHQPKKVQERLIPDDEGLKFTEIDSQEGLQEVLNNKVYLIEEFEEFGDYQGTRIVFYNEETSKYIIYLFYKDGDIFKSDWY